MTPAEQAGTIVSTRTEPPLAYRTPRRSFSRSAPRRFKRRGTRLITEPKKWEMANFHFTGSMTPSGNLSEGVVLDFLSQCHFDDFGVDAQVRGLTDAIRTVNIGGIVWTTMLYNLGSGSASGEFNHVQEILYTDRIDPAGSPVSGLTTDWWDTQAPIAPGGLQDGDFPVRVHARHARVLYCPGTNDFAGGVGASTLLGNAALGAQTWPSRSLRLRGGLGDRQGLFLQLTTLNNGEGTAFVGWKVVGSLYYQVRM